MRKDQKILLVATVASIALWFVPMGGLLGLPLVYLNTHIHEFMHAFAALLTGGGVSHIKVFANGSGVALVGGGGALIVASAGYVGASIVGASMILMGARQERAKTALAVLGGLLAFSMVFWVRGDLVGILSGLFWVLTLFVLAKRLKGHAAVFAAQFLGVQQCLTSAKAIFALLKITAATESHSDARLLQAATGVPAMFWAVGWALVSMMLMGIALIRTWNGSQKPARRRASV